MKTYEFKATDTRGIARYYAEGNSFEDIFKQLCEKEVISGDEVDNFVYKESGTSADDYCIGDDDYDQERYDADYALAFSSDADYYRCITQSKGNAYFQIWKIYDDETNYIVNENGELIDKADLWEVENCGSNIRIYKPGFAKEYNHDECIDYTYEENMKWILQDIEDEVDLCDSERKAIEDKIWLWVSYESKKEE